MFSKIRSKMYCDKSVNKILLQAIIFLLTLNYSTGFCPTKCTCLNEQNSCIDAGLDVVPIQLNPDSIYINLTLNKINDIAFTLMFYSKLEVLDLSRNKIANLGSKSFEQQNELRLLNMSQNSITSLTKDSFRGLHKLEIMDLSVNRIDSIHSTTFGELKNVKRLDLTDNNLTSFDEGVFSHMRNLEILIMKDNQLLEVPAGNLVNMRLLKSLDMSGNLIETLRNDSFGQQRELTFLNLQGNVIREIETNAFEGLIALKVLDLSDNNLTIVPTLQLSKLSNLTYLSLSGNFFTALPPVALLNLFHLRELYLEHLDMLVKIDSRSFVDNTNLQIISLDYNPTFGDLPSRLFHGNPNLVEISMRGNNLVKIDAAQFPLDRLQRLRLADNPLECNCSILWLWRLASGQNHDSDDEHSRNASNVLVLDKQDIGCDLIEDKNIRSRRTLKNMSESDINCPGNLITIISLVFSILLVVTTLASVYIYVKFQKRRKKIVHERKNVNERIVPQQVDKLELERYLAAQAIANEYRALRPWEIPVVKQPCDSEPDHYEKFEYFDRRTLNAKPHVVYV